MRHRVAGTKLGRSPSHRRALLRNLVTELLNHEAVRTTDAKAKELKRWGDRMITLGKQGTLAARRRAAETLQQPSVVQKLFNELAPRYTARAGGYTRITKLGPRPGDAAPMSIVELLDRPGSEAPGGKKKPARRRTDKADAKKADSKKAAAAG